jgi:hypothetical protein
LKLLTFQNPILSEGMIKNFIRMYKERGAMLGTLQHSIADCSIEVGSWAELPKANNRFKIV